MGVLGLAPFLQKTCPEVIKQLPDRLRSLAGKTLVIDGTLITQRLHFAAMPHKYRHVLGWYKVIEELKSSNVNAICVFDGSKRSKAKAREIARRKDATRLTALRGTLEAQRLDRLKRLTLVYSQFERLSLQERLLAVQALLTSREQQGDLSNVVPTQEDMQRVSGIQTTDDATPIIEDAEASDIETQEPISSQPLATRRARSPSVWRQTPSISDPIYKRRADEPQAFYGYFDASLDDIGDVISLNDASLRHMEDTPLPDDLVPVLTPATEQDIVSSLVSLYADYTKTATEIVHLSKTSPATPQGTASDYVMTKSQLDLSVEEGQFWEQIMISEPTKSTLTNMEKKSSLMSESFDRRTQLPTTQTYTESKAMINAMGIPCIDVEGEYEAEAVASSMVINGLADCVVSEDTDVLVYEAPLLRNITNSQGPLTLVSGSEVRAVLGLSSPAFLDFALLLGTDFTQRIKNVGPSRAYKFIREHGSIETVVQEEIKYPPQDPLPVYLEQVECAREVFRNLPPVPDKELLVQKEEDRAKVQALLKQFRIEKVADNWDSGVALAGNYFQDRPGTLDIDTDSYNT